MEANKDKQENNEVEIIEQAEDLDVIEDEAEDEIIEDERFKKEEPSKQTPISKEFKKQNKKANRLRNFYEFLNTIKSIFRSDKTEEGLFFRISSFTIKLWDFALNTFTVLSIVVSILAAFYYLKAENPYMTITACVLIVVLVWLNEKII